MVQNFGCLSDARAMLARYSGNRRSTLVSALLGPFLYAPLPSAPATVPGTTIKKCDVSCFLLFCEIFCPLFRLLGRCLSDARAIPGGSEITPSIRTNLVFFGRPLPSAPASMPGMTIKNLAMFHVFHCFRNVLSIISVAWPMLERCSSATQGIGDPP